ncbi:cytochrome P450 [Artomyces pyxidatus]|uniref:Cytochrome P450 n=1 Tax=Artomyces pyxidatus TaxID=48021 RepID=A0ACB8T0D3_9AGAM|nr:cytochrome P450 [Artomyces pyxidatus]
MVGTSSTLSVLLKILQLGLISLIFVVSSVLVYRRIKQAPLRKLYGPSNSSFFSGNYLQMFNPAAAKYHEYLLKAYGRVIKINGFFGDQQLIISDPKALTSILVHNLDAFEVPEWFLESNRQIWGTCFCSTTGSEHRRQRKQIIPVFSTSNLRALLPLLYDITHQLRDVLQGEVSDGKREVDALAWAGRLALEFVAQGALGYTFDSLNPHGAANEFGKTIKEFNPALSSLAFWRMHFHWISKLPPRLLRLGATVFPMARLRNLRRITTSILGHATEVLDEKKALLVKGDETLIDQVSEGKTFIGVLMRQNDDEGDGNRIPEEEIIAQMSVLIFASADTTSSMLARIFHLLAEHQDIQEKLRKEISQAYESCEDPNEELGYHQLLDLPLLEAICCETLRLYPAGELTIRQCRSDMTVPLSRPLDTARGAVSSLFIPHGTTVFINIAGINKDPDIWGADAMDWKPERWLARLPETVAEARIPSVYGNLATFIAGGRACIGFNFALLEMKVALVQLVKHFRLSPSKQEVFWRFGGISVPSVKGSSDTRPRLPIVMERI